MDLLVSPPDWQRAKAVLTIAADLAETERARQIEAQFPDEPTLRAKLLSMLDTYDKIKLTLGPERTFALSAVEIPQTATSSSEERIRVGAEYHRYRVVQPLGAGGMGQVFLAEDVRLGRRVALKSVAGRWLGSPAARQRLLREGRAAAALSHPHIATLYDVLEDERYFLLVMEYVQGRTAAAVVAEGPVSLSRAVRLTIQICDAVVYAHDHGIIHCDLKPANVQVTPDGTAKVLDFGLAHAKYDWYESDGDTPASEGLLIGTPAYMPPERLLLRAVNVSDDIYSLGVTLFEMVTGRRPFVETNFAALTGAILGTTAPRASSIVPACPAGLDTAIARALAKDPKERYQTAGELSRDLHDVLRALDTDSVALPPPQAPRSAWPYSRSLSATLVVLATIVSLTLIGFVTSTAYSLGLGLTMSFEGESPVWWPVWGLRSLVLPLAQIGFTVVLAGVGVQLWRIALAVFKPLRRWCERIAGANGSFTCWLRSIREATLASGLLVAHVVTLGFFLWSFRDVLGSLRNFWLQSGRAAALSALAPDHADEHKLYVRALSLLVLVFGWSWYRLLKRNSQTREQTSATIWAAAIVMIVLTFGLMISPYRTFFHSRGERVLYQSQSCYLVGQKKTEGKLFCALQGPPWNRLVDLKDPALVRSGTTGTIFSARSASEPKSEPIQ